MSSRLSPWFVLVVCLWFAGSSLQAQIVAPDFLCVRNDTLVWQPATNTCGPFVAYEVFASQNPDGPYTVLATVTNPAQTSFFHADANNQLWYYYLQSNHNCPGQSPLQSDTLDNRIPLEGPLRLATVEDGNVRLEWDPSPSPQTFAYVISRTTAAGTTVIDTVFGGLTSYLDTSALPNEGPETYFVEALDPCGNKSLVGQPHTTIFLTSMPPNPCAPTIALDWNFYVAQAGITAYEVFVSTNGQPFAPVDLVGMNVDSYSFDEVNDGDEVCFYVEAVHSGSGLRARSSVSCQTVSILQPIRRIDLLGVDIAPDGSLQLEWLWDPAARLTEASVLVSRKNDDVVAPVAITLTNPLTQVNTFAQAFAPALGYTASVSATDECGNQVVSEAINSICLTGLAPGNGTNQLSWTPFENALLTNLTYELVRTCDDGNENVVFTGNAAELAHADPIDVTSSETCCYHVRARVTLTDAEGKTYDRNLRSNRVCLDQPARLYVPNVFAPTGINRVFRPQTPNAAPQDYLLEIYDRWGGKVFESRSLDLGWDGDKNNRPMPQGVYVYRITFTQANGQTLNLAGDVTLIR